ncbi:MAG: ABC transporter permease [Desulfitobacteriaceae bacterium]|nr:ABC transporter permease [Desulfitobacteriaceae bacterium]
MDFTMVFEHLYIVLISVVMTVLIGLPLGILAYSWPSFRKVILWVVDVLQTIPALALLGIIMVFLGAGKLTVIIGLVLYSLLPIVHNTYLGLNGVNPAIKEAARGMGMTKFYRLVRVELPLAFPVIFTGIRIASVTAIGVAVFATFVGGGGLGSIIYRGIYIQNMKLLLSGTLTLMAMAVLFDSVMAYVEKRLYRRSS